MNELFFSEDEKNEKPVEMYSGATGIIKDYDVLKNVPTIDGVPVHGDITRAEEYVDKSPTKGSKKLLTSGAAADALQGKSDDGHSHDGRYYTEAEVDELLEGKCDEGHSHDDRYYTESEVDELLEGKCDEGHSHDDRYYTESEVDKLLEGKSNVGHFHPHNHDESYYNKAEIDEMLSDTDAAGHNHDDRYYTESEVDELLEGKSDKGHSHDDRYYTGAEVDELLEGKSDEGHSHDDRYYTESEVDELLDDKSNAGHSHSYNALSDMPQINGVALSGNKSMNKLMFRRVLTSADDCDRLFEDGWYVYSTSSVPKNAPFANASVIEVFGADSTTTQKVQRGYRYGDAGYGAFRALYNSKWHPWSKIPVIQSKVMQHNTTTGGNADLTLPVSSCVPIAAYGESLDGNTTYRCTFYKSPAYAKWFGHFTGNSNETPVANTDIKVTVYYINL